MKNMHFMRMVYVVIQLYWIHRFSVFYTSFGLSEKASFYTATIANQGKKLAEVDDSREVTFSEWNSKSFEERKELTREARKLLSESSE